MTVVVDTNVLVSGLLSPYGPPGAIVRMLAAGELQLCLDARILAEYRDVLARPRFGFDADLVAALLDQIQHQALIVAGLPLPEALPDPDDEAFLEVAIAGRARFLVTGNLAHFPEALRAGVTVVSPTEFVATTRGQR